MSDEPDARPPGWSDDQPPPFRPGGSGSDQPADGWQHPGGTPPPGAADGTAWAPPPPAPKPGVVPLRPLGVGEIMAGAIDYVRREPKTVISVAAMVGVVAAFLQLVLLAVTSSDIAALPEGDPAAIDPDELLDLLVTLVVLLTVSSAVAGVLQIFGTGMLTHVMGRAVVGASTTVSRAWQLVRPQLLRLIAATVLVSLSVFITLSVPVIPGIVLLTSGATTPGAVALVLGSLVSVVLGVFVTFRLILTTPVLALEDCGPVMAMKRSWRLVHGAFWRTLAIVFLGSIVAQAVGSIVASPFSLLGSAGGEISTLSVFGLAIAGMVTTLVALPFIAGVTALVYIDRRMRTENLATVLIASSANPPD